MVRPRTHHPHFYMSEMKVGGYLGLGSQETDSEMESCMWKVY